MIFVFNEETTMYEYLPLILILGSAHTRTSALMEEVADETGVQPPNWDRHLPLHIALHRSVMRDEASALVRIMEKAARRTEQSEMVLASNLRFLGGDIILPVLTPLAVAAVWTEINDQIENPGFKHQERDSASTLHVTIAKGATLSDYSRSKIQPFLTEPIRIPFCMTALYQRPAMGGQWKRTASFQIQKKW